MGTPARPLTDIAYGTHQNLLHCIETGATLLSDQDPATYNPYLPLLYQRYSSAQVERVCDPVRLTLWRGALRLPWPTVMAYVCSRLTAFRKRFNLPGSGPAAVGDICGPAELPADPPHLDLTSQLVLQLLQLHDLVVELLGSGAGSVGGSLSGTPASAAVMDTFEQSLQQLEQRAAPLCPLFFIPPTDGNLGDRTLLLVAAWRLARPLWHGIGLDRLVRTLMVAPLGPEFAKVLAFNLPDQFSTLTDGILAAYDGLPARCQPAASRTIQTLCKYASHRALSIRDRLVRRVTLPEVVLKITLHFDPDQLAFLSTFFAPGRRWDPAHYPRCLPFVHELKARLYSRFGSVLDGSLVSVPVPDLILLWRILGSFVCVLDAPLDERDAQFARKMIPALTSLAAREAALAYVMVSYQPLRNPPAVHLLDLLPTLAADPDDCPALYLLAVFLRTQEFTHVETFIRTTLGLNGPVGKERLYPVRDALLSGSITDADLARFVTRDPPPEALGDRRPALHLGAHSLLKHRVFQTQNVDLGPWVYTLIRDAHDPPRLLTVKLIKEYADATLHAPAITRLPEPDVRRLLDAHPQAPAARRILLVFYLLYYQESLAALVAKPAGLVAKDLGGPPAYSDILLDALPIKAVLNHMTDGPDRAAYQDILPEMVALCHYQSPETFDIKSAVVENYCVQQQTLVFPRLNARLARDVMHGTVPTLPMAGVPLPRETLQALQVPERCGAVLRYLTTLDLTDLVPWRTQIIETCLPLYLEPRFPFDVLQQFRTVWEALHVVGPREVEVITVRRWRARTTAAGDPVDATAPTVQDLWLDPLQLFRCDPAVFRRYHLFSIWLQILGIYTLMSRQKLRAKHTLKGPGRSKFKEPQVTAMLYLQDTAALQMLLEVAAQHYAAAEADTAAVAANTYGNGGSAAVAADPPATPSPDAPVHLLGLVWDYLHQCFIDNRLVCKLLHFQTYPPSLIPAMVEHIPSLHICLEYLPELLHPPPPPPPSAQQPQAAPAPSPAAGYDRPLFALQLTVALLEKYPLARHLSLIRETVIPRVQALITKFSPADTNLKLLYVVVDTVAHLAQHYPTVQPEVKTLLQAAQAVANKAQLEVSTATAGHPAAVLAKCGYTVEDADDFKKYVIACIDTVSKRPRH
ncbi:hypothetical protein IWQ60_010194 [Tieghemiomyces parasiticus]|uniref:Uncharacterized protein n=1 Tax=Tieghemiomyces parasiticus TaxID=78921 RepID=A0A9W8DN43_9FUNG|nr:hypothetical protein IWQ60_010194 [Tieghemiomyces parasiticus]